MMQPYRKGAEASLKKTDYLGKPALLKERAPKKYRHQSLDERIRKERTSLEARLISRAKKAGIMTPVIYAIDKERTSITMEFIEGTRMKDALNEGNAKEIIAGFANSVALLHNASIIHGDLTTSNVIIHNKGLAFVDFGLGYISGKADDKATDILVFKKTFQATHFSISNGWEIFSGAYMKAAGNGREILAKIPQIEAKTRYS